MHAPLTRAGWLFVLPLSLLCLSGCESLWPKPAASSASSGAEAGVTPPAPSATNNPPGAVGVRSRLLGSRTLTLPPTRALEVNSRCNFANETGYKGDAVVEVKEGVVRQMRVLIDVPEPNKGRCIFDMTGMVQTKSKPSVELNNRTTGCTARMWEQGETAVVSFSQCATSCTSAESFKYVWPVLIHRKGNRCD
ncbi:MAG TPA: hypothetical protein VLC92_06360 [Rhodocyclaceae bacterium]|nr:hypothetical protein [Rhodocyclaceae bacterium]